MRFFLSAILVVAISFSLGTLLSSRITIQGSALPAFREKLEQVHPEIVFVGDSRIQHALDQTQSGSALGKSVLNLGAGGKSSAYWYLILKNVLVASAHIPELVAIAFESPDITLPADKVSGRYRAGLEEISLASEPVVEKMAYFPGRHFPTRILLDIWPLTAKRDLIKHMVERKIQSETFCLANAGNAQGSIKDLGEHFFHQDRMDKELYKDRINDELIEKNDSKFDFRTNEPASFLPEIVQLARKHDIRLLLINMRVRALPKEQEKNYTRSLADYLQKQGIAFLDYSQDRRFESDDFKDAIHMSPKGATKFTAIVSEDIRDLLKASQPGAVQ